MLFFILMAAYLYIFYGVVTSSETRAFLLSGILPYSEPMSREDFRESLIANAQFAIAIFGTFVSVGFLYYIVFLSLNLPVIGDPWLLVVPLFGATPITILLYLLINAASIKRRIQDFNLNGDFALAIYVILQIIIIIQFTMAAINLGVPMQNFVSYFPASIALIITIITHICLACIKSKNDFLRKAQT